MQNSSAEEYKLVSRFQALRKTLLADRFADRWDKPLVFWTLHSDRRLPLAFLPCPLKDLLEKSFDDLAATPGVGQKKIATLLTLLTRAAKDPPPSDGDGAPHRNGEKATRRKAEQPKFDPSAVSEGMWQRWRNSVCQHHLGYEKLGRLAPSLQSLATVMWYRPLSDYCDVSIAEMRQMKTHGEKRVRAILEVFHAVNEVLDCVTVENHLAPRMVPRFVPPLEDWLATALATDQALTGKGVRQHVVAPLVNQVQIDCGQPLVKLAEGRLGMSSAPQSVRQQAKKLGVTRARVYQMLEECAKVMRVRWPEGAAQLAELADKIEREWPEAECLPLVRGVHELFFSDEQAWARQAASDAEAPEG